jgi:hypothetical protein
LDFVRNLRLESARVIVSVFFRSADRPTGNADVLLEPVEERVRHGLVSIVSRFHARTKIKVSVQQPDGGRGERTRAFGD